MYEPAQLLVHGCMSEPGVGLGYQCGMQVGLDKTQLRRLVADWQLECCPEREGNRAEGGCKVPPRADGVS